MLMLRRILLSVLLLSLSIACAQAGTDKIVTSGHNNIVSKQVPLPDFNAINVSGDMQVKMIASTQYSDVRLIGPVETVAHVVAKVANGTLFLRMSKQYRNKHVGKLVAIIRARHIDGVTYHGRNNFTAIDVKSPAMKLKIDTPGRVNLSGKMGIDKLDLDGSGVINITGLQSHALTVNSTGRDVVNIMGVSNLHTLNFSGSGWMSIYWVNSPRLTVRGSGKAYVQVAGTVGLLDVKLCEHAYFNAHYLRTKKVFIKTYDFSRADLQTTTVQNALASDQSNIYYYKDPDFNADYMAHFGTVLSIADMG